LINIDKLKKYIAYCRQKVDPRLSEDAAETLKSEYVNFRAEMRKQTAESGKAAIPITV
jgi:DNA replication licensing factor MCM5